MLLCAALLAAGCALPAARTDASVNSSSNEAGTGAYPALMETDPGLPTHTIYRPADLATAQAPLPIIAWGNGGCANYGDIFKNLLTEIASHGYLVIAIGPTGAPPPQTFTGPPPGAVAPARTQASQLLDALDWATAENVRRGSRYFGRLDVDHIALMGQSCGGLQVLQVNGDPRVDTSVILNSGIFPEGGPSIPGVSIDKSALAHVHSPILYVLGGRSDIAYANGMDDFARLPDVPAVVANLDVGHMGTYIEPNGGRIAPVVTAWLDWQLKGDRRAATLFAGPDCGLCTRPEWIVERRNVPPL